MYGKGQELKMLKAESEEKMSEHGALGFGATQTCMSESRISMQ